jgi:hypothetical protein
MIAYLDMLTFPPAMALYPVRRDGGLHGPCCRNHVCSWHQRNIPFANWSRSQLYDHVDTTVWHAHQAKC